jgi:MraZ protein
VGESGWKWSKNTYVCLGEKDNHYTSMTFFTSEYESKLDAKGRLVLPARIKAQLPETDGNVLMIRKSLDPCLIIYPMVEFNKVFSKISGLNEFNKEAVPLQRSFFAGITEVEMDNNGRILIPKKYLAHAQIEKDIILVGMGNKVEVWNPVLYEKHLIQDPGELSTLAQKYLGE